MAALDFITNHKTVVYQALEKYYDGLYPENEYSKSDAKEYLKKNYPLLLDGSCGIITGYVLDEWVKEKDVYQPVDRESNQEGQSPEEFL